MSPGNQGKRIETSPWKLARFLNYGTLVQYDCNYAPFELNGVAYSWWNDRNGTARYFWAGNNSSAHTCQCGLDRNCVDSLIKCNCDSLAPVALADDGN